MELAMERVILIVMNHVKTDVIGVVKILVILLVLVIV